MKYTSPTGEVLDVPGEGGHALIALGWTPEASDEDERPRRRSSKRDRSNDHAD